MNVSSIGIAGAGLMGRLLALAFAERGVAVTLFDRDAKTGEQSAAMAAAGLLALCTELDKSEPVIYELGLEGIAGWETIIHPLHPQQLMCKKTGSLVVSHTNDAAEKKRYISLISSRLEKLGVNVKAAIHSVDKKNLLELEPELSEFDDAYYFPNEGFLDAQQCFLALGKKLDEMNVTWFPNTNVTQVSPRKIEIADTAYSFDLALDCRGLGAYSNFPELRPIRGELIWVQAPDVTLQRPVRLVHPRYSIYVVPRPKQIYVVGASEIESGDRSPISVKTMLELLSACYSLHKGFLEARVIKTAVNCRPALPDQLPSILYADGFIGVNGLYRHGYLIAPALVNEVLRFVEYGESEQRYPQLWKKNDRH